MQLPIIAPGKRYTLPRPVGSADALLLARLGRQHADEKRVLAVFTAEPADTQRLADELPFFEPGLRVQVFPDWETLPYDTFSPHQDLVSERLAALWAIHSGEVDVVLMPASRGTAASAAKVCATTLRPASGEYCFGPPVPARWPTPAQGTRAKQRAAFIGGF